MASIDRIAERYSEACDRLGLVSRRDAVDGDVFFEDGGATFVLAVEAADPEFLHLVLPSFHQADLVDEVTLIRLAHGASDTTKVGKVVIGEDRWLSASVEMIAAPTGCLPTTDHLAAILPRAINIARHIAMGILMELKLHALATDS